MTSKSLEDSVMATLKQARIDRDRLINLIAGLELTLDGAVPVSRPVRAHVTNGKRYRGPVGKRGETEAAAMACMLHYGGKAVTTPQVAKYMDAHRPPSLQRKQIDRRSWLHRADVALRKLEKAGKIHGGAIEGRGNTRYWNMGKAAKA